MASESGQIVLFDLPTRAPRTTWSLNPWKTRLLLAYKGLDYRTEWVEYPDVRPTLEKHVAPNPPGETPYTIPTIKLPDGTYVMDSRKILEVVNERYPNPPLRVESRYDDWFKANYGRIMGRLRGIYIPLVPKRLLNEASLPYWYETRAERNGMPVDQLEKECGGDKAWDSAAPLIREVTEMLAEENEGPFFLGREVSYVDFWWAGILLFFRKIGEDCFGELMKRSGEHAKVHLDLLEAVKTWSERDDY